MCAGDVVIDANVGKIEVVSVDDDEVGKDVDGMPCAPKSMGGAGDTLEGRGGGVSGAAIVAGADSGAHRININ